MKYALALLLSGILAASTVTADMITGDWGYRTMNGGSMFWMVLKFAFFIGLLLLVWLWVIKLWREVFKRKK